MTTPRQTVGLVGLWFHSFTSDGLVSWQGKVLAQITPEMYLVQLYEWLIGQPGDKRLTTLTEMKEWSFYDTNEEMNDAYEHRHKYRTAQAADRG